MMMMRIIITAAAITVTTIKAIIIKSHIEETKDNQKQNLYKRLQQICTAEKILCIYFSDTGKRHPLLGFSGRTPQFSLQSTTALLKHGFRTSGLLNMT
jgi:hypothetical protein